MATHSSILAWKISWTEEPGRIYSIPTSNCGLLYPTSPSPSFLPFLQVQN